MLTPENRKIALSVVMGAKLHEAAIGITRQRVGQITREYCKMYFMPSEWRVVGQMRLPDICKKTRLIIEGRKMLETGMVEAKGKSRENLISRAIGNNAGGLWGMSR